MCACAAALGSTIQCVPLRVSEGHTQPSAGLPVASHRISRMFRTREVIGRTRLAAAVFAWVTRKVPCLPFVHVIDSQHNRKHSSGRRPVSQRMVATEVKGSGAAPRYFASSSWLTTRSRCLSPGSSLTSGLASSAPHSTASLRTRRRTRMQPLILLTCRPSLCR